MSYVVGTPDNTPDRLVERCTAESPEGFRCTLDAKRHDAEVHAAGDGLYVVDVWPV